MFFRLLIINGPKILFRFKSNGKQMHYSASRFQLIRQSYNDDDLATLVKELDSIPK